LAKGNVWAGVVVEVAAAGGGTAGVDAASAAPVLAAGPLDPLALLAGGVACACASVAANRATNRAGSAQPALIVFAIVFFPVSSRRERPRIVHYRYASPRLPPPSLSEPSKTREPLPTCAVSDQRSRPGAISPGSGRRGGVRGALQCGEVQRDQCHRAAPGARPDQQDPRTHPLAELLRARRAAAHR